MVKLTLTSKARAMLRNFRAQADDFAQLPAKKMTAEERTAFFDAAPVRELLSLKARVEAGDTTNVTNMTEAEFRRALWGGDAQMIGARESDDIADV